jgi:hypothetical protein
MCGIKKYAYPAIASPATRVHILQQNQAQRAMGSGPTTQFITGGARS